MSMILTWQELIPGQNQNAEREYLANQIGTTHRFYVVSGKTLVNGEQTSTVLRATPWM